MLSELLQTSFPSMPSKSGFGFDFFTDEDLTACVVTAIASGAVAVIDTNDAGRHGICRITSTDGTDDKGGQFQLDAEPFQLEQGKTTRFITRVAINDATQSDMLAGLCITDTSLIASAPTNGIYFRKDDGDAFVDFVVRSGDVDRLVVTGIASMANNAFMTLAFDVSEIDGSGNGRVRAYVNGTVVVNSLIANLPTAEALTLSGAGQSGAAAITNIDFDAIHADQDR